MARQLEGDVARCRRGRGDVLEDGQRLLGAVLVMLGIYSAVLAWDVPLVTIMLLLTLPLLAAVQPWRWVALFEICQHNSPIRQPLIPLCIVWRLFCC